MERAHDLSAGDRTLDISVEGNITFSDMLLSESTLAGLRASGFRKPSPIQKKAIPLGRCGYDLLVQAKSGTGKTCVFSVIAMEMLIPTLEKLQVVILAPTREISVQIANVLSSLTQCMGKPRVEAFIGGLPLEEDKKKLSKCQVAVGAPGRMRHLISAGFMDLRSVRLFVLDEADRLMEENFRKDIRYIYSKLPANKQMIAASATFPEELEKFVTEMMKNQVKVTPGGDSILLGVRQFVSIVPSHPAVIVQMKNKMTELMKILSTVAFKQCLVFSNYQSRAESICDELAKEGWPAIYINGSQTQLERLRAFASLKEYRCRVLLSTDLTSRGIDAENVNLVVNMDLPYDSSTYIHRIGRAGRYGSRGLALTILQDGEEVERFRCLLNEIGGENFTASIFPREKPNFDVWTASDEKFEKLAGVPGEYKSAAAERGNRSSAVGISGSEKNSAVVHSFRLTRPEKLAIDDFETLARDLADFGMEDTGKDEVREEEEERMAKVVSAEVDSTLIQLERMGWKLYYSKLKLPEIIDNAGSRAGVEETEDSSSESEEEISSQEFEDYPTSSDDEEEESDGEDADVDVEESCQHLCHQREMSYCSSINNWYAMWLRQTRLIGHYTQYCHYWKEMVSFR